MNKTVFILAGGNDRQSAEYGPHLSEEIAKYVTNPRVLSCFFSAPKDEWKKKARDWEAWFTDQFTQPFTYDYARPDTFLKQVDVADVVYFHGGNTELLLSTLPATEELKKHLEGKVVVGSSAGSNMLSKNYWSSMRGVLGKGKAIVEANVMVHYGAP